MKKTPVLLLFLLQYFCICSQDYSYESFIQNPVTNKIKPFYEKEISDSKQILENYDSLSFNKKGEVCFRIAAFYLKLGQLDSTRAYYTHASDYYYISGDQYKQQEIENAFIPLHFLKSEYDSVLVKLENQLLKNQKGNNYIEELNTTSSIIQCHLSKNEYKKAGDLLPSALEISRQINDSASIGTLYYFIAEFFFKNKNFISAEKYYGKAVNMFKNNVHYSESYIKSLVKLSFAQSELGNNNEAFKNATYAVNIAENNKSSHNAADGYAALGQAYKCISEPDSAIVMYLKALHTGCNSCPEIHFIPYINDIAKLYLHNNEFDKAMQLFRVSLNIAMESKIYNEVIQSYFNIGEAYYKQENYHDALNRFLNTYDMSVKYNNSELLEKTTAYLSDIYYNNGNKELALKYKDEYTKHLEDHLKKSNSMWSSEFEFHISLDDFINKKEIEWLNEKQEASEVLNRQKSLRNLILLISFFTALFGIYFLISFKRKQKDNLTLLFQKEEISRISDELHMADKMKLRFFTNISHELRTPLTLVYSPLERLRENIKETSNVNLLDTMIRNTKKLKDLTNQLADISALENMNLRLDKTYNDFNSVLNSVASMFYSYAEDKKISFRVINTNRDIVFSFDKERIEQVITNLLSNSFKFTPDGGEITLHVPEYNNELIFYVKDTGPGIPADDIDKIFNRFYQSDQNKNFPVQGTGIGLNIVKEYVELHNGTVSVRSNLNEGTEVEIRLPVNKNEFNDHISIIDSNSIISSKKDLPHNSDIRASPTSKCEKLLIIEDNIDLRNYLETIFSKNYKVLSAADGEAGKQIALNENPDLIISDIMMPLFDGYQLTKHLKSDIATSHIPIILLTAKADQYDKISGYQHGADDYITKPFNENELLMKVHNILQTRSKFREKFKKNISVNPSDVNFTSIDEQFLIKLTRIVEDNISNPEFTVEQLCKEAGISQRGLYGKLKALTGMHPSLFIRSIRLKRAAQLLKQKTGNVSDIAYETGFENLSYFTKCFKDTFNTTPSKYC